MKKTPLCCRKNGLILQFKEGLPNSTEVLYSTTEPYNDSSIARNMLSITYFPRYKTIIDDLQKQQIKLINNKYEPISLTPDPSKITRVWPAFGRTGGSFEFLITYPQTIQGTPVEVEGGGAPDEWHQDAVWNFDQQTAKIVAAGISDVFQNPEEESLRGIEGGQTAKVTENGIAINSSFNEKNITISVAWRDIESTPHFKLWACLWKDDLKNSVRVLLRPYTKTVTVCLGIFPLDPDPKKYLRNSSYARFVITEATRSLLKNITLVSEEFFQLHSRRQVVPRW